MLGKAKLANEMRKNGNSWQSISDKTGVSYKALKRAIEHYAAQGLI